MRITKRQLRKLIKESIIVEQATDKQLAIAQSNIKTMIEAVGESKLVDLLGSGGEAMKGAFISQFQTAIDNLSKKGS